MTRPKAYEAHLDSGLVFRIEGMSDIPSVLDAIWLTLTARPDVTIHVLDVTPVEMMPSFTTEP